MKIGTSLWRPLHYQCDVGFQPYVRHKVNININNRLESHKMVMRIFIKEYIYYKLHENWKSSN